MPVFPAAGTGSVSDVTAGDNVFVTGTVGAPIISSIRDTVSANFYCGPLGDDTNDGLGWQTAKKTVLGAVDAAIMVNASNIHIAANTHIGPVSGDGLWLAGALDPGYATFTNCVFTHNSATVTRAAGGFTAGITVGDTFYHGSSFKRYVVQSKNSDTSLTMTALVTESTATVSGVRLPPNWRLGSVAMEFKGWAGTEGGLSPQPMAEIIGGFGAGTDNPAIWLSGTGAGFAFRNLQNKNAAIPLRMGVGSNGVRSAQVGLVRFEDCELNAKLATAPGDVVGPTIDLGYVLWCYFKNVTLGGTGSQIAITANNRALVYINPATFGTGLLYFENCRGTGGGGIKHKTNGLGYGIEINKFSTEGDGSGSAPIYWLTDPNDFGRVRLHDLGISDDVVSMGTVLIDGQVNAYNVLVSLTEDVRGPATILSIPGQTFATVTSNPSNEGQVAFWQGQVVARQDSDRRNFGAVGSRFQNLIDYNVAGLTPSSNIVLAAATSPDGLTNAGRISTVTAGTQSQTLYSAAMNPSVGDWIFFGGWVRRHTRAYPPPLYPLIFNLPSGSSFVGGQTGVSLPMPSLGDGEWQWLFTAKKVAATGGSNTATVLSTCNPTNTVDVAYPVLTKVATGAISDNEAHDLELHWKSATDYLAPGMAGTMPAQKFIGHGGFGTNSANSKTVGVGSGQLTLTGSGTVYLPTYAANGTTIIGWTAQLQATVNP